MLTIAYITARKEPRFEWFSDSLHAQAWFSPTEHPEICAISSFRENLIFQKRSGFSVKPKPCVWQGQHRLTREDWFAAGNARNTALCLARGSHIAYVDDLSVLTPGWLAAAIDATKFDGVTCGAYRKVRKLVVENGKIKSFEPHCVTNDKGESIDVGMDHRWKTIRDSGWDMTKPYPTQGGWMFGCSLVAPVEMLLNINGWCEDLCAGLGFEDCVTGVVLGNNGAKFRYDPRMMTLESQEGHEDEPRMRQSDYGVSPKDKSHKAIEIARTLKRFDNGFDLRQMREDVLAGKPFPIPTEPKTEWFTGTPLADL